MGGGGGGGGVEHVFDVAFLMPVQMSGNTWMGEGGCGAKHLCNSVVKEPSLAGSVGGGEEGVGAGPACDIRRWRLPAEDSTFPHVNVLLAVLCYWKQLQTERRRRKRLLRLVPGAGAATPDPGPARANAPVLSHAMCNHGSRGNSCNSAALLTSMVPPVVDTDSPT